MIEISYPSCFEDEFQEVSEWCAEQFGIKEGHEYTGGELVLHGRWSSLYASLANNNQWRYSSWFYFRDESDAALFTLRWL